MGSRAPGLVHERDLGAGTHGALHQQGAHVSPKRAWPSPAGRGRSYPNLKSAETRLDKLTWLSAIESVASSLIMTSDPACDIALVSAA